MRASIAATARFDHVAERVAAQLKAIRSLPRAVLMERWTAAHGRPPPKGLSRRLLVYAAAYHVQVKAFGGLKPVVRRRLLAVADRKPGTDTALAALPRTLAPGSRLVREWRGRSHTVEVLEQGFLCDGRHYRSLSEVARAITGARWSGPRFFGL